MAKKVNCQEYNVAISRPADTGRTGQYWNIKIQYRICWQFWWSSDGDYNINYCQKWNISPDVLFYSSPRCSYNENKWSCWPSRLSNSSPPPVFPCQAAVRSYWVVAGLCLLPLITDCVEWPGHVYFQHPVRHFQGTSMSVRHLQLAHLHVTRLRWDFDNFCGSPLQRL